MYIVGKRKGFPLNVYQKVSFGYVAGSHCVLIMIDVYQLLVKDLIIGKQKGLPLKCVSKCINWVCGRLLLCSISWIEPVVIVTISITGQGPN